MCEGEVAGESERLLTGLLGMAHEVLGLAEKTDGRGWCGDGVALVLCGRTPTYSHTWSQWLNHKGFSLYVPS